MLFNSFYFIFLFLPVSLVGFYGLSAFRASYASIWLVVVSLAFYAFWNYQYTALLTLSILFNYFAGLKISGVKNKRKYVITIPVAINLTLLFYFKYFDFAIENINRVFELDFVAADTLLPLGISFFTFTQIAFLVDVYQGKVKEYSLLRYFLFVTYFPHLIAGPVLHHKDMMPQFADPLNFKFNSINFSTGLTLFVIGLSKKVILADSLASFPTPIFEVVSQGGQPMFFEAWIGALSYTLQLYFDFSGYSDMAIGLSLLFNVRLPMNFNSPYKATSIIDFWRRWHITLSHFLRDYLYIPLGGNKRGEYRRYLNLFITMFLGGVWHGAGWGFVVWGALHGMYLTINHLWRYGCLQMQFEFKKTWFLFCSRVLTFVAVVVGWVFFKADNVTTAFAMLKGMSGLNGFSISHSLFRLLNKLSPDLVQHVSVNGLTPLSHVKDDKALIYSALALLVVWGFPNSLQILKAYSPIDRGCQQLENSRFQWRMHSINAWILAFMFILSLSLLTRIREFLYFQF